MNETKTDTQNNAETEAFLNQTIEQYINTEIRHWSEASEQPLVDEQIQKLRRATTDWLIREIGSLLDDNYEQQLDIDQTDSLVVRTRFALVSYFNCKENDIKLWSDGTYTVQGHTKDYYVMSESCTSLYDYERIGTSERFSIFRSRSNLIGSAHYKINRKSDY